MASVKSDDIPEVRDFMKEYWRAVREYWTPETSEAYWRKVIDRMDELAKKYPDTFCQRMCWAFIDYLDKEARAMRK